MYNSLYNFCKSWKRITVQEADRMIGGSWKISTRPNVNWVEWDGENFVRFCEGSGQDTTVWKINIESGKRCHRGTGEGCCYSDWE